MGTLNMKVAGRTPEQYRKDNEEHYKTYSKNRYEQNKDTEREKRREKYKNDEDYKEQAKQRAKKRWENKKDECKEQHKTYREEHKLELTQWFQTKVSCPCGGKYTLRNKAQHFQCKKHKDYLNNINIENVSSTQEETNNTELQKADEQTNRESIGTGDI